MQCLSVLDSIKQDLHIYIALILYAMYVNVCIYVCLCACVCICVYVCV